MTTQNNFFQTIDPMLKIPAVTMAVGRSRSNLYRCIKERTFPKGIKMGNERVAWLLSEVKAINSAYAAGKSENEIRNLVIDLESARKNGAKSLQGALQ
jgi:prophage regulatory protein